MVSLFSAQPKLFGDCSIAKQQDTPTTITSGFHQNVGNRAFHRGRGLFLLLAVATGFYMLKVPNWESLPLKY